MGFPYDATGVSMNGPQPFPQNVYDLKIVEATDQKDGAPLVSKKGYPMVKCKLEVVGGDFAGRSFWHWVTFLPKESPGAGMSVNFLKHIGEPWEGAFDVEPESWIDKPIRAMVKVEEDNQGRKRNSIGWLAEKEEEVPF